MAKYKKSRLKNKCVWVQVRWNGTLLEHINYNVSVAWWLDSTPMSLSASHTKLHNTQSKLRHVQSSMMLIWLGKPSVSFYKQCSELTVLKWWHTVPFNHQHSFLHLTVTVLLSLYYRHCHCITVTVTILLSLYCSHCHCITVTITILPSLSPYYCHCITVAIAVLTVTVTVLLSLSV